MTVQVRRILVPLDLTPDLAGVVEYACAIARGMGASLTFLHVYEPPNAMIGMVPGATVVGEVEAEQAAGESIIDRALEISRANGIDTADRIVDRASSACDAIVAEATRSSFDLIVMGTHGRTGVARLVMGSVAEQVSRHAPCPVLLVHLPRSSS